MNDAFIDCTTLEGQRRIRGYVLGWLERLDYGGRLDRGWPVEELAGRVWDRVEREFAAVWLGPVVENRALCRVIAETMVEDYYAAYPARRCHRYSVLGDLPDVTFRRCVLDFIQDIEEYEPAALPRRPESAAEEFWATVREHPDRWGCKPERGDFVDDEPHARALSVEVIREYFALQGRVAEQRAAGAGRVDG
ncbi:MAG: hypothetical protein KY464_04745 [Gemmatimonadetes bacterium]|nr:hypothetical protein [Gemmatimonadota bacterium]